MLLNETCLYSEMLHAYGTFLQQLECGYGFPALVHVWIASAGVLELFISTSFSEHSVRSEGSERFEHLSNFKLAVI